MLFDTNHCLLFLNREKIEFWGNNEFYSECQIPSSVINNLEIIDQKKLEQLLNNWLASLKQGKQNILFILGPDMVFEKTFSNNEENIEEKIKQFFAMIPFDAQNIAKINLVAKENTRVFATNDLIIHTITQVLAKIGWKTLSVIPLTIFQSIDVMKPFDHQAVKQILSQSNLYKTNFYRNYENETDDIVKSKTINKNIWLIIFLLLAIGVLITTVLIKNNIFPQRPKVIITPTVIPTKAPTPTLVTQKNKDKISMQILNGSGIAGEASRLKKTFEEMQFVNIDTGNAEETADQTKVEFLPQAETLAKTEVENKLKELYQSVTVLPQTASSSYDITITIGGE